MTFLKSILTFVTFSSIVSTSEGLTWRLDGIWLACNTNFSICINATVPGCIHRDLQLAGIVKDVTRGFEDKKQKWIAENNWIYSRKWSLHKSVSQLKKRYILLFKGLDTIADVYLNGISLGRCQSMFLEYQFDITKYIKSDNVLKILFHSAVTYASDEAKDFPYVVPPRTSPKLENGFSHPQFIRKEQSSFGWDWGPAAASMGIYKTVQLIGFELFHILSVVPQLTFVGQNLWRIDVKVFLMINPLKNLRVCLDTFILELAIAVKQCHRVSHRIKSTRAILNQSIWIDKEVELWWPHGMGSQKMYNLTIEATDPDSNIFNSIVKRIGFRTIQLVQDPVYPKGLTFLFRINGRKLFLKGSNWIPARVCPANVSMETMHHLLISAKFAHMNILRVWGGGVYETDEFYDMADELGILLWQDAMFACAMYPADEKFLLLVEQELRYQIRRLSSHPSVLIYAGNNENEKALRQNWYGTGANFTLYYEDYVKLYVKTIRRVITAEDPTRPFITSSPSNGAESEREGWVAKDPADPLFGDLHPYHYEEDGWDYKIYPKGRFISEFGLQSLPSFDSLLFAANGDASVFDLNSDWMKRRQHHPEGYEQMLAEVGRHFKFSLGHKISNISTFKDLIYLTQVNQAMSIKTASEYFRVLQSFVDDDGCGGTMGAMFWQLNDVWTAPTWSSIEYSGRWKLLHYYARDFFAPLLVTHLVPHSDNESLTIYGVSDLMKDVKNLELNVTLRSSVAFGAIRQWFFKIKTLRSQSSMELASFPMDTGSCSPNCYVTYVLKETHSASNPHNFFFPQPFKKMQLRKSIVTVLGIRLYRTLSDTFLYEITILATEPAFFVWVVNKVEGVTFSENGFHMSSPKIRLFFECNSISLNVAQFEVFHLAMTIYDY